VPRDRSQKRVAAVEALLANQSTLSLATIEDDGSPRVTPLFYVADGLRLYWFSSSGSAHSRNLVKRPEVFAAVYPCTDAWKEIRGLQMRGSAAAVKDRKPRMAVTEIYRERFRLGGVFNAVLSRSTLYEFLPVWVRCVDNSHRLGYRFEITPGFSG
jgi:uncharacterized protein YhbP (UPF0306 family)